MFITCSAFPRKINVSDRSYRKKTHLMTNNFLFFFENRAVYDTMWENIVELGRPHMTIWRMRIACWITKATNTTQNMSQKRICCFLIMSSLPLTWSAVSMTHCDISLACDFCLQHVTFMCPQKKSRDVRSGDLEDHIPRPKRVHLMKERCLPEVGVSLRVAHNNWYRTDL